MASSSRFRADQQDAEDRRTKTWSENVLYRAIEQISKAPKNWDLIWKHTLQSVRMAFDPPYRPAGQSAEFWRAFNTTLPAEIKVMIIKETVTIVGPGYRLDLKSFAKYRKMLCEPLENDETLLAEAHKQFERVNTFRINVRSPFVYSLARNIRHLDLEFNLEIESGDLLDSDTFIISAWDVATTDALPAMFPQLESLTYRVFNLAAIANNAVYTYYGGWWPVHLSPEYMTQERMRKMDSIMHAIGEVEFERPRRNMDVKKKVVFRQVAYNHSRQVTLMTDPAGCRTEEEYIAALYRIMDSREVNVYAAVGNSNSRLGQSFGKPQFRIPGATFAKSKEFSKRFAALPAELQVMIIGFTVTTDADVSLARLFEFKDVDCGIFMQDKALFAEACTQYRRLNTFCYQLGAPLDISFGQTIRRLTFNYSIVVTGGNILDLKTFGISDRDASYFHYLPDVFPQLENLLIQVDNTGKVAPGAVYLCPVPIRVRRDPRTMALDRMWKMAAVIRSLRALKGVFRPIRRNATLNMRVIFVQVDSPSYCHIYEIADTALTRTDERGSYLDWKGFYQLMDYPRSGVCLAGRSQADSRE